MRPSYYIFQGRHSDILKQFPDNYFGSFVSDPPYGISFMNKHWDYDVPSVADFQDIYRVMKPGAYGAVFCGTRTQHRMVVNMEDAGFEIRDIIAWLYGSGMSKGMDISKSFDKEAGADRDRQYSGLSRKIGISGNDKCETCGKWQVSSNPCQCPRKDLEPITEEAKQWEGWRTGLKPAMELITLIRKPLIGTVVENIREYGVGGLNIDASRVPPTGEDLSGGDSVYKGKAKSAAEGWSRPWMKDPESMQANADRKVVNVAKSEQLGRFPANVIHDGSDEVLELFPKNAGAAAPVKRGHEGKSNGIYGDFAQKGDDGASFRNDSGSAARFFYVAKASPSERNAGTANGNKHTTVKPVTLMKYLVKLLTPPGEIVLDCYAGSGTTGVACMHEGFECVLVDQDAAHVQTIHERLAHAQKEAAKGVQTKLL